MEKYVYLLRDGNGNVVDVGESKKPKRRLYMKTKRPIKEGGSFHGRTDITLEVVAGPMSNAKARVLEGELKLQYGLEWTEMWMKGKTLSKETKLKLSKAKLGKPQNKVTCPHCNKEGGKSLMHRYHFDNCKQKHEQNL